MSNNRALGDFATNLSVDPSTGVATFSKDLILGANAKLATPGSTSDSLVNKAQVDVVSKLLVKGLFYNLKINTSGASALISILADEIVLQNSTGGYVVARNVNVTPSIAVIGTSAVGVDGMDSNATVIANTWYSIWIISDGINVKGLISPSATSPSLPAGYTYQVRVGWIKTDTSGNKYPLFMMQIGKKVRWRQAAGTNIIPGSLLPCFSGVAGSLYTPAYTSNIIRGIYTPSTALSAEVGINKHQASISTSIVATAVGIPFAGGNLSAGHCALVTTASASISNVQYGTLVFETDYLYYVSDGASGGVYILGWEDNI